MTGVSTDIGFGHLRRSSSLAEYLRRRFDCNLYNQNDPACALTTDVDLVIFDIPSDQSEMVTFFRNRGVKTIGLDTSYGIPPDLTLSIFEHNQSLKGNRESGFQFIIIRDEILELEPKESRTHNRAIVLLGGGDINHQSNLVADRLLQYKCSVTLVFGPLARNGPIRAHTRLRQFHQPENLPELMNDCDFAITNGGGCLFEMLYLGKPVFIIPQTKQEKKIANYVAGNTPILGVGLEDLHKLENVQLHEFGELKNSMVSGQGLKNIEMRIMALLGD